MAPDAAATRRRGTPLVPSLPFRVDAPRLFLPPARKKEKKRCTRDAGEGLQLIIVHGPADGTGSTGRTRSAVKYFHPSSSSRLSIGSTGLRVSFNVFNEILGVFRVFDCGDL